MQPSLKGRGLLARLGARRARREGSVMVRSPRPQPLFDVHPGTGASIEVFYADRTLETFGRVGGDWYWCYRRRGLSAVALTTGPFGTSAYTAAVPISSQLNPQSALPVRT